MDYRITKIRTKDEQMPETAVDYEVLVHIAMNNWLFWTARNVLKCTDIEQFAKT